MSIDESLIRGWGAKCLHTGEQAGRMAERDEGRGLIYQIGVSARGGLCNTAAPLLGWRGHTVS